MRTTKDILISIFFGLIIALLTSCGNDKSPEELKAEYLEKLAEIKSGEVKRKSLEDGSLNFKAAHMELYEQHDFFRPSSSFIDTFCFTHKGHRYIGFYEYHHGMYNSSPALAVVHDPDCPCNKVN